MKRLEFSNSAEARLPHAVNGGIPFDLGSKRNAQTLRLSQKVRSASTTVMPGTAKSIPGTSASIYGVIVRSEFGSSADLAPDSIRGIKAPAQPMVRGRKERGRAVGARPPAPVLALANQRWSPE